MAKILVWLSIRWSLWLLRRSQRERTRQRQRDAVADAHHSRGADGSRREKAVIEFLRDAPAERKLKAGLLLGWAQEVGLRLRQRDYVEVQSQALDA